MFWSGKICLPARDEMSEKKMSRLHQFCYVNKYKGRNLCYKYNELRKRFKLKFEFLYLIRFNFCSAHNNNLLKKN